MHPATEQWRAVLGYEGRYEVSTYGRIRSVTREFRRTDNRLVRVVGRLLALPLDSHGYQRITVYTFPRAARPKYLAVHRLVLAAFVPTEGSDDLHVNHKDGVKTNNRIENLEWCTASENRLHSYRVLGRSNPQAGKFGGLHHNARAVVGRCIATCEERRFASTTEAESAGFRSGDVAACARGDQRSHKGWLWRYAASPAPADWVYAAADRTGANNWSSRAVECIHPDGQVTRYAAASLAADDGFSPGCINHCLKGRNATHRGCTWRYAEAT